MPATPAQNNTVRPPVIAVMGHIDHGKSTLLDHIRQTNVTDREAGGITQHASAYEVRDTGSNGQERVITFLDTPGHAAFSGIRERGVRIADIAILIVSAEDGVKPQTVEALKTIREAKLPFIVAINKIDKPAANIERTKANLAENEIYIEGYGGDVPAVPISAKAGTGIPELLDMIELVAEMQELRGDPSAPASGYVLESNLDPKKGITATLIVKDGSLRRGQFVSAGGAVAPVRIMENFLGKPVSEAAFSSPIRIIGWDRLPRVGETFKTYPTRNAADADASVFNASAAASKTAVHASDDENAALVPVAVKADTVGSLEAVMAELEKHSSDRVAVRIVHSGIGTITENDLKLVQGSTDPVIIGFNVKSDPNAKSFALKSGLEIREFNIIYKLTEWFEEAVKARIPKVTVEEAIGTAKVLKLFSKVKDKQVIGGRVESGRIKANEEVKVMRRDAEIGRGTVKELQHNKMKASEAEEGMEFGALVEFAFDLAPGDRLEAFQKVER